MNIGLVVVGVVTLVLCLSAVVHLIYTSDDADVAMIRAVMLVVGLLLGVALVLEGVSGTSWEGWLSTFTT